MNLRRFLSTLLLAVATLSAQDSKPAFRRDLLAGSWKVNWDKSKLPNPRPASQLPAMYRQYQDHGDGFMLHTVIAVAPGQQAAQLQLLGAVKYDNKEYPTYTPQRLTDLLANGKQPAQTVSFKVVDAYNMEWTDRTSGKVTAFGTMALSQDGKTMSFTTQPIRPDGKQTSASVLMYEKQ